ncbi:MAG: hypothetical protein M3247_06855 [Thermoproteota archaeon]|nr:hypothetical protein [Thermoproteota archaeon]
MKQNKHKLLNIWRGSRSTRKFLVVVFAIIAVLMVDVAVSTVIDFFQPQISSNLGVIFFILVGLAFALGQYFVLSFVQERTKVIRSRSRSLQVIGVVTVVTQYALICFLVVSVLQMVLVASYSSVLLSASVTVTYALSITTLGVLSYRFLSWYRSNRNSFILLYGLAAAVTTVNGMLALAFFDAVLVTKPAEIAAGSMPMVQVEPSSVVATVQDTFKFSAIASFALLWVSSVLLIRQYYYQRFGRKKYWLIASAPLVYLIIYFVTEPLFDIANAADPTLQFYYFILFSFWNAAGGMIFGAAFIRVARSVKTGSPVKDYMIIAGCGLILLFVSGGATVIHNPYPPFGFATTAFIGLSSYMLLLGLYSSAVSVSQDIRLRLSIRRSVFEESKLLDRIGSAEMQLELQKKVIKIAKDTSDNLKDQSGIEPSITDDDIKQYLKLITKERDRHKTHSTDETDQGDS